MTSLIGASDIEANCQGLEFGWRRRATTMLRTNYQRSGKILQPRQSVSVEYLTKNKHSPLLRILGRNFH